MHLLPIVRASRPRSQPHRKFLSLWRLAQPGRAHFPALNLTGWQTVLPVGPLPAWVLDRRFMPQSGKPTHSLGCFGNGSEGCRDQGREISWLSCRDVDEHGTYGVRVRPTDPVAATSGATRPVIRQGLTPRAEVRAVTPCPQMAYVVADGAYSTRQFLDGVEALGLHHVGQWPRHAHRRYGHTGPQARRGRPRIYGDRFPRTDLSPLTALDRPHEGVTLYHGVRHHRTFPRWLRVVTVRPLGASPTETEGTLRFRTDTDIAPDRLYCLYRARFPIACLFRDAKPHQGLNHGQARSAARRDFHFHVILAALTWAKIEQCYPQGHPLGRFSLANVTRQAYNRHLREPFMATWAPRLNFLQSRPEFQAFCPYGQIVPATPGKLSHH